MPIEPLNSRALLCLLDDLSQHGIKLLAYNVNGYAALWIGSPPVWRLVKHRELGKRASHIVTRMRSHSIPYAAHSIVVTCKIVIHQRLAGEKPIQRVPLVLTS